MHVFYCTGVIVYKPTANYKLQEIIMLISTLNISGQVWPLYISIDIMKSEKGLQDEELNKGIVKQEIIINIKLSFILMHQFHQVLWMSVYSSVG